MLTRDVTRDQPRKGDRRIPSVPRVVGSKRVDGRDHLRELQLRDLTTYDRDLAYLTGIPYAA